MAEITNGVNPEDVVLSELEIHNPITGEVVVADDPDALVGQWMATKELIRQIYRYKDEVERVLVEMAGEGPTKTTYLETEQGTIKVQRKDIVNFDNEKIEEAVFLMGEANAMKNGIKKVFKPNLTTLRKFLATKQSDKTMETARELLGQSMSERPAKPSVTLADNRK